MFHLFGIHEMSPCTPFLGGRQRALDIALFVPGINDALEIVGLQRSAADQAAVDVRLCEQLWCIASLAATAIEDGGIVCNFCSIDLC